MTELPFISVIIPTRNRRGQLRQSLTSLATQNYSRDLWEVIVVEDGDEGLPDEGLAEWTERLPLRSLRQSHSGCGIARNTGATHARGRYLVFTDDDCLFPEDWLSRYGKFFERMGDCVVAGRSINVLEGNPYSETTQELINFVLSRFNATPEQATLAIGNNFGVPAVAFRELGGFSPKYFRMAAEDRDFSARWLEQGRRIVYAPDIVVHHAHPLNLQSLLRQHFHYGRGAYLFHLLNSQPRRSRGKLESPGFYFSLLLWPWSVRGGAKALRLSLLFLLAQAAQTGGYFRGWLAARGKMD